MMAIPGIATDERSSAVFQVQSVSCLLPASKSSSGRHASLPRPIRLPQAKHERRRLHFSPRTIPLLHTLPPTSRPISSTSTATAASTTTTAATTTAATTTTYIHANDMAAAATTTSAAATTTATTTAAAATTTTASAATTTAAAAAAAATTTTTAGATTVQFDIRQTSRSIHKGMILDLSFRFECHGRSYHESSSHGQLNDFISRRPHQRC